MNDIVDAPQVLFDGALPRQLWLAVSRSRRGPTRLGTVRRPVRLHTNEFKDAWPSLLAPSGAVCL